MPFKMIPENKSTLTWTFFQKVSSSQDGSGMVALTATKIEPAPNLKVTPKDASGKVRLDPASFTVTVRVDTLESWVVSSAIAQASESNRLLNHERTHYLLASCVAWECYQQMLAAEATSAQALATRLTQLLTAAQARMQKLSDQYDDETKNGTLEGPQRTWDVKIEKWDHDQHE